MSVAMAGCLRCHSITPETFCHVCGYPAQNLAAVPPTPMASAAALLVAVCDRAILLSPADRATVDEIRASLKLRRTDAPTEAGLPAV